MCLESWYIFVFWLVCVCLWCRKLCLYRLLQWLIAQGEPLGWTPLLRCCLMCVVTPLYSVIFCTRVLGAWCLVWQDPVSCYFYFVLLPLPPELWWVWCYIIVLYVLLCYWICLSCVLWVWQCLWIIWWNNSQCIWVWLLFCCWMLWKCLVWVEVLCWIDRVCFTKECACFACDPSVHLSVRYIGFVYVFVCRRPSPHLRVRQLDHRCLLLLCCLFVWFCILYDQVIACSSYASWPLVCWVCLPSVWCL